MAPDPIMREWVERLDDLAEQANSHLVAAGRRCTSQSSDYSIGQALVAIATQLQYGNAIAAAEFYMEHLNEEGA